MTELFAANPLRALLRGRPAAIAEPLGADELIAGTRALYRLCTELQEVLMPLRALRHAWVRYRAGDAARVAELDRRIAELSRNGLGVEAQEFLQALIAAMQTDSDPPTEAPASGPMRRRRA